ncbi:MAG: hypothetical protein IJT87_03330 [Ruminiclostridium sp.]|nr:hypothetical protein [Ruminiclostridium sp.]
MKRVFIILPFILAISACSAQGAPQKASPPDISFSAEADITYGGESCKAQIRRLEADNWEFCVTEPYPVQGLVITVANGETKLKMYDMESIADINADAVSMAKAIALSYDTAASGSSDVTESGGGKKLSGSSELGTYSITLDESGNPVTLGASAGSLSASITKFAALEREAEIIE